jgi:hypothetical protein
MTIALQFIFAVAKSFLIHIACVQVAAVITEAFSLQLTGGLLAALLLLLAAALFLLRAYIIGHLLLFRLQAALILFH